MEPQNDSELRGLLKEWRTPELPSSLEGRVLRRRESWWRFLLQGYVRVPMPVVCCLTILLTLAAWRLAKPVGATGACSAEVVAPRAVAPVQAPATACLSGSHC